MRLVAVEPEVKLEEPAEHVRHGELQEGEFQKAEEGVDVLLPSEKRNCVLHDGETELADDGHPDDDEHKTLYYSVDESFDVALHVVRVLQLEAKRGYQ
eukprot:CAMPEP_0168354962 /NCGR_PEP_ID=MMETSP0213-20121227/24229_1 /TAXON_ID=151035 /ORGANISM="Euplotes harpa, Strain FSP1.4" /LENGTH=97 /DNA_ID=CAMNT_0008367005 /DNA_START=131 /DNA_END=425 /DNA_ORIENTATION=+